MIYRRKVHFYETDAQGIVHHSNYPRYFEEARGYYLEQIGYPYEKVREELGIEIVLVELTVNYKKPLSFGDSFEVDFRITDMDRFTFTFEYEVRSGNGTVATGKTRHTCLDRETRKIVSVPQVLRKGKEAV
ncbi:MAG: acyl-CoA thioesterase [Aquificae bacterium]|nr:acyl-CoA thioesterase [Aquificota bacterium]